MLPMYEKKWQVFCLVAVSIFMSTLDSSIVNVALPYMMQGLQTDILTIQWVMLIYLAIVSSLLLTFGRLSDIHGRKPIYILGFIIFTLGSFFCGLSETVELLICSRSLQGCGAAMLMACSPAMVVDAFPVQERGRALGMVGAVVASGLTCGPAVGGFLLEYFAWPLIFYINIPIGMAACFCALLVLNKDENQSMELEPMDTKGSFLLFSAIFSWTVFLSQLSRWGVFSVLSMSVAGLGMISSLLFCFNEASARYPLFDPKLLKIRLFVFPVLSSAVLFAALFVIVFMMPFYLTYPCGFSATRTGLIMIVPFLFLLIVSPLAGMGYDRYGSRRICMLGMGILMLSLLSLIYLDPTMGILSILWRVSLAGLGTALYISPNNTAAMNSIPLERRGVASGAVATSRNLGMVIGVALAGLIFSFSFSELTGGGSLENYTEDMEMIFMISFRQTMQAGGILAFIGLILTFLRGGERTQIKP